MSSLQSPLHSMVIHANKYEETKCADKVLDKVQKDKVLDEATEKVCKY